MIEEMSLEEMFVTITSLVMFFGAIYVINFGSVKAKFGQRPTKEEPKE